MCIVLCYTKYYTEFLRGTPMAKRISNSILRAPNVLRRLILSWLIAVSISYLVLPGNLQSLADLEGLRQMSMLSVLIMTGIFFCTFTVIGYYWNKPEFERWFLLGVYMLLSGVSLHRCFTWPYFICCSVLFLVLVIYALQGWNDTAETLVHVSKSPHNYRFLLVLLAAGFVLFVSIWTVCRVYSFCTPTYDFGIFSQMFYNMKSSGLPYTTVERDGLLSHFYVHVSPIYYLLLPIYYLFPFPATLQILQAVVLACAVVPLWKLCRLHKLSATVSILFCAILLVYPAFSGGTSYDLHENAFLAPLILWLLYGIDRKNTVITIVSSGLVLLVKEDAAVYVAVIALYLFLRGRLKSSSARTWSVVTGLCMFLGSVLWFLLVTSFLDRVGDGVMTYRYRNFMYDDSGSLLTVIKSVLLCPMKAVYESVDSEKLKFIFLTLAPLLGLPLFTRRYERYILLIPYILINLMSDYPYQHDIFFQYTYGSTACLFYLAIVNLTDLRCSRKQGCIAAASLAICSILFIQTILPVASRYPKYCLENKDLYQQMRQTLSLIPDDAAVSASTFYTTHLSQRKILYDVKYASLAHILSTEYVAIAINNPTSYTQFAAGGDNGFENFVGILESNGYELFAELEQVLVIYHKPA